MNDILAKYVTEEALVFGAVCGVLALALILLDWLLLNLKDRSLLDIAYGSKNRWLVLGGWSLASAFVGILSGSFDVVQTNLQGAVAVSVAWPALLSRIVDLSGGGVPVQEQTNEEVDEEDF